MTVVSTTGIASLSRREAQVFWSSWLGHLNGTDTARNLGVSKQFVSKVGQRIDRKLGHTDWRHGRRCAD